MDPVTQFPASSRLSLAAQAAQNAWDQMLTRTTTDQAFRAQLLADPVATLRGAGIAVPDGIVVTPLEFDPAHAYFFLPPPPSSMSIATSGLIKDSSLLTDGFPLSDTR